MWRLRARRCSLDPVGTGWTSRSHVNKQQETEYRTLGTSNRTKSASNTGPFLRDVHQIETFAANHTSGQITITLVLLSKRSPFFFTQLSSTYTIILSLRSARCQAFSSHCVRRTFARVRSRSATSRVETQSREPFPSVYRWAEFE